MRSFMRLIFYFITLSSCTSVVEAQNTTAPAMSPISSPTNVAPIATASNKQNQTCYTNTTEINLAIKDKDPFIEEIYVLCANTVFLLTDGSTADGMQPIILRSRSVFQCGDDAKSTNGCVITGGIFQIYSSDSDFTSEKKVGIIFRGVTFDSGIGSSALLISTGDVTFIDCIFQNHANNGVIVAVYTPQNVRQLSDSPLEVHNTRTDWKSSSDSLKDPQELLDDERDLQASAGLTRQVIAFDRCQFLNNTLGPESPESEDGIITALPFNDIILKSCVFQNNKYSQPKHGQNGYAVSITAGQLSISDTCFLNNDFVGAGVVLLSNTSTFTENKTYGTFDDELTCPFAAMDDECVDYSSDTCTADIQQGTIIPVPRLTEVPIAAPMTNITSATLRTLHLQYKLLLLSSMLVAVVV